jgi:hypothetical protein
MTSRSGTGVSVLADRKAELESDDKGNVYLNDNRAKTGARAPTEVDIMWESDTVLVIQHYADAHVLFAVSKLGAVTVKYGLLEPPS